MEQKFNKEYIARCEKRINNVLNDPCEYGSWSSVHIPLYEMVKYVASIYGCNTDEEKHHLSQLINELAVDKILPNITEYDIDERIRRAKIRAAAKQVG